MAQPRITNSFGPRAASSVCGPRHHPLRPRITNSLRTGPICDGQLPWLITLRPRITNPLRTGPALVSVRCQLPRPSHLLLVTGPRRAPGPSSLYGSGNVLPYFTTPGYCRYSAARCGLPCSFTLCSRFRCDLVGAFSPVVPSRFDPCCGPPFLLGPAGASPLVFALFPTALGVPIVWCACVSFEAP